MHESIFVKAIDWSYEREVRIWLPGTNGSEDFQSIPFEKDELGSLYVGCRTPEIEKTELLAILKSNFPHATAFQGRRSEREFALHFEQIV